MRQKIEFARSHDNIRLAWTQCGSGPVLVKASNWLTHLQYDWKSSVWRHWMEFLGGHFHFVRFDERGCGMSDWEMGKISDDVWLPDLECVIEAADINEPFILLGISQGAAAAIRYAVKYPDRISGLILYGGYARGWKRGGDTEEDRYYDAIVELMSRGWGDKRSEFRRMFATQFIPDASEEQIAWFDDLCRKTTTGEIAARLMDARAEVDVTDQLPRVCAPTLVIHARNDALVPLAEGRQLAANIPDAQFVELESANHILLEHEPAWEAFCSNVLKFSGLSSKTARVPFSQLSPREADILALICEGLSNARIADRLCISEKTVRNNASNLFGKLGVKSRTEAMVHARDWGFWS